MEKSVIMKALVTHLETVGGRGELECIEGYFLLTIFPGNWLHFLDNFSEKLLTVEQFLLPSPPWSSL